MNYIVGEPVFELSALHYDGGKNEIYLTKKEVLSVGKKYIVIGAHGIKETSAATHRFVAFNNELVDAFDMFKNQKSHYFQSGYLMSKANIVFDGKNTCLVFKDKKIAEQFIKEFFGYLQYTYSDTFDYVKSNIGDIDKALNLIGIEREN